jgi:hypothetical protein
VIRRLFMVWMPSLRKTATVTERYGAVGGFLAPTALLVIVWVDH